MAIITTNKALKMKSLFNLGLLCCLVLVCSCNKTRPEDAADFKYNITMGDTLDVPTWGSLIDSVCYIPLKTDSNTIMDVVEQLVVKDNLIYVLANGVYCFDMEGNCKFKINKGRARNEFLNATTLSVSDGHLYLYDSSKHKGIVYDAQTGEFIENVDIPIGGRRVYFIGDYFIFDDVLSEGPENTRFKVYSKKRPDLEKAGYFSDKEHERSIGGTISWSNDGLIYSSYLRNLSWKINGKECIPYIKVIVPEGKRLPDKTINYMISEGTNSLKEYNIPNAIYGLSYLAECDGFISGQLIDNKTNWSVFFIYDKETGNARFFNSLADKEPWQKNPIGEVSAGDANCMYTIVTSESVMLSKEILGGVGNEPTEEKFRQAYNVIISVKEDDNPIVARFWLKGL